MIAALYHQPANALPDCHADPSVLDCFRAYTVRLEPEHREQIERLVNEVASSFHDGRPITNVSFVGFAAQWRDDDPKESLAIRRALAAREELARLLNAVGIGPGQVTLHIGHGLDTPRAGIGNGSQAGRALNRRVEIAYRAATPKPTPTCRAMSPDQLRQFVRVFTGYRPHAYRPAVELARFVAEADFEQCGEVAQQAGWPAGGFCVLMERYITVARESFTDNWGQHGMLVGSAYAVLDAAHGRTRALDNPSGINEEMRAGFRQGYEDMSRQLVDFGAGRSTRGSIDQALGQLACAGQDSKMLRIVYDELRDDFVSRLRSSHAYFEAAGSCQFGYPKARARCRPMP